MALIIHARRVGRVLLLSVCGTGALIALAVSIRLVDPIAEEILRRLLIIYP